MQLENNDYKVPLVSTVQLVRTDMNTFFEKGFMSGTDEIGHYVDMLDFLPGLISAIKIIKRYIFRLE